MPKKQKSTTKEDVQDRQFKIDDTNYATDPELVGKARKFMQDIAYDVYSRRQILDRRYLQYYNIFRCIFDTKYYEGISQVYIPQLRKNVEAMIGRIKHALFPTDDIFSVEPTDPDMDDESQVIQGHLKYQIEKKIKLKTKIDRMLRQYLMYGWCPVKCVWEKEEKTIIGLEKVQTQVTKKEYDPLTDSYYEVPTGEVKTEIHEVEKKLLIKNNPTFEPVDVFNFYMYPYSANSLDEVLGVFELDKVPLWELQRLGKEGFYENTDQLREAYSDNVDLWQWAREQRLAQDGLSDYANPHNQQAFFTTIKYSGKFNWGTPEDPDWKDTFITTAQNDVVLEIRTNQYYDQDIPYLLARFIELQSEIYSTGIIEPLSTLQYYLNDTLNQTFDCVLYELNPIIKYDPGRVVNINSISFAPGAMWALNDPAAATFDRPPDVSNIGFNSANQVKTIIDEYPGLQNIPLTGRKAATHIQAIQSEYSIPVINIVQNLEEQLFNPWLKKAYIRNQQFIDDSEIFMVTGKKGVRYWQRLEPEMLVADYNFYWRGANQTTDLHVKAQSMNQYLQTIAPFVPMLAQQGKQVDLASILQRIWTEGLAMDGEVIKDASEDRSIDPNTENILLAFGKYIPVSPNDDDNQHLQVHQQLQQNEMNRSGLERHKQAHNQQMAMKQAALRASQQPVQNSQGSPGGQQEVPGERQLEGNQPVGNQ